jgi:hypothetical protein
MPYPRWEGLHLREGSAPRVNLNDADYGRIMEDRDRSTGWLSLSVTVATCVATACLAFVLSTASFGILSLPILVIGLIVGGIARSRWARWPAFSAVFSVVALYTLLWLTGR